MPQQVRNIKIMISGGGTGGHVFPAIAIADALENRLKYVQFLFVGAVGKMEMGKVPAAGYKIEGLNISGFQRRLTWKNLKFPFKLIKSMIKARRLIKDFQPDVVIGVGGYASGPVVRVASRKNIPALIQEQNSFPGITNRILARSADKICVAYDHMERYFPREKIYITGNPVRQNVVECPAGEKEARTSFGLEPNKKTILVLGGSLGARSINQGINNMVKENVLDDIQLIWQTGKYYIKEARQIVEKSEQKNIYVTDFISRMDLAYKAASFVVSRAGAIAISELQAVSKPAILVPSPNVAEDHQTKNAMALVNYHAATLVKDQDATENLGEEIKTLIYDQQELEKLNINITKLAKKDAADTIAGVVLDMIKID